MNEIDESKNGQKEKKMKTKKKFIITYSIWFAVIFIIFILTLIRFRRLIVFGKIGNAFQIIGLFVYVISLITLLTYYFYTLTILIIKKRNGEEWYDEVSHIFNKLDLPAFVLKCISVLLFLFVFLFNPCTVTGSSMEETFSSGDKIMASSFTKIDNGDVIIFDSSNYSIKEAFYIKRVIAQEGDEISYLDGHIYVNNIKEERGNVTNGEFNNILLSIMKINGDSDIKSYIIPDNKLLVLGDNRLNSLDSRSFGLIDEDDVYGEAIIRFYPFDKFSFI